MSGFLAEIRIRIAPIATFFARAVPATFRTKRADAKQIGEIPPQTCNFPNEWPSPCRRRSQHSSGLQRGNATVNARFMGLNLDFFGLKWDAG
jgi:hypothetical protein